jgi:hypothetical protein
MIDHVLIVIGQNLAITLAVALVTIFAYRLWARRKVEKEG